MELKNEELLDAGFAENQVQVAETTLNGQDPTQIAGLMVSSSISAAQDYYSTIAKPIPDNVKQGLSLSFPLGDSLMDVARYAVGDVEIALPTAYGKVGKKNISEMISRSYWAISSFSNRIPWLQGYPLQLWGNELKHVADYEAMKNTDPDGYAFAYMAESSSLPDTPRDRGKRSSR